MGSLLTEQQIEEFSKLLTYYRPNNATLKQFQNSNFCVIAGPTAAGKDTLRNALLEQDPQAFVRVLSTTTRPSRPGEQEGVDYYFSSAEAIKKSLLAREVLQAELIHNQQVSCMHIQEVSKLTDAQIGLSILLVQTEAKMRKLNPKIKTIFLIPPTLEVLRARMHAERVLNPDEIHRRLKAAKIELEIALGQPTYYCLTSGDLQELTTLARQFLKSGERDVAADDQARRTMKNILKQL